MTDRKKYYARSMVSFILVLWLSFGIIAFEITGISESIITALSIMFLMIQIYYVVKLYKAK